MVLLVPGLLAFVFGWFAFRSRVTGVYLSIITQAMTYALLLAFFRNDFGFGGNNGLTDFKDILGYQRSRRRRDARRALRRLGARAGARLLICRGDRALEVRQGAGRGPRRREPDALPRLPGRAREALRLRRLGLHGRHRRRALRAAGRHHQSRRVRAGQLDRGGDLGRGRRPRHAGRADHRRRSSSTPRKSCFTGALARSSGCSCSAACSSPSRCSCRRASSGRSRRAGTRSARAAAPPSPKPARPRRRPGPGSRRTRPPHRSAARVQPAPAE